MFLSTKPPFFRGDQMLLLLCIISGHTFALPEDSKAVITMHAGAVDLNQSTHLGVYSGGVALDQGTTHIRATSAQTQGNEKHQLIRAEIKGNQQSQAHYWTLIAPDKPIMHAYADTMLYYPLEQRVELIGHARVTQGQHHLSAPILHYHLQSQQLISLAKAGEQTTITIHPEQTS